MGTERATTTEGGIPAPILPEAAIPLRFMGASDDVPYLVTALGQDEDQTVYLLAMRPLHMPVPLDERYCYFAEIFCAPNVAERNGADGVWGEDQNGRLVEADMLFDQPWAWDTWQRVIQWADADEASSLRTDVGDGRWKGWYLPKGDGGMPRLAFWRDQVSRIGLRPVRRIWVVEHPEGWVISQGENFSMDQLRSLPERFRSVGAAFREALRRDRSNIGEHLPARAHRTPSQRATEPGAGTPGRIWRRR